MASPSLEVEMANVQGLVVRPYKYKLARHALFSFGGPAEARQFLSALIPQVATGATPVDGNVPVFCNVALTYSGLAHLGQTAEFLSQLDPMLAEGPDPITLGDIPTSTSDPANWWDQQFSADQVHCMVQLFAREAAAFQQGIATLCHSAQQYGLTELIPRRDGTRLDGLSIPGGKVHFGYKDGISQPDVCWDEATLTPGQLHFRNFVLGYATDNVYSSPGTGAVAQTLRDSSYLVLRWIYQDVAAFNRYLDAQAPALAPHLPLDQARELVAAKLVGRWRDGTPLVLSADGPSDAVANSSNFSFVAQDPDGFKCPFSAHIRVCNPRDQPLDAVQSTEGVPRLIRRGIPYGPELNAPLTMDDGVDRGLIGVFLCSNIRRQFYTLTRWIEENSFSPVFSGNRHAQDPLLANRKYPGAADGFMVPGSSGATTLKGLPEFVHTKGTAFFLLPSIRALHYLSTAA